MIPTVADRWKKIDFSDTSKAFLGMSTGEVLRGAVVYQFCSYKILVNHSMKFFDIGRKYAGKHLFEKLMKASFYGHFAASERPSEILKMTSRLSMNGIDTSLAYSVEDDMTAHCKGDIYEDVYEETLRCIRLAGTADGETSVAIKITAFLTSNTLFSFNQELEANMTNESFEMLKATTSTDWRSTYASPDSQMSGDEKHEIALMMSRVRELAACASRENVRLIVDAEHMYFQTAIRLTAILLMREFNRGKTVVINTYQNYLKKTRAEILADVAFSEENGFNFGAKMVRGAYMDHERERAALIGYEDPVHDTYEDTNNSYNANVNTILERFQTSQKLSIIIASHNEDTVHLALKRMAELGLDTTQNDITFAQLMGMCDHITYSLSNANVKVYKYVPYGPVAEVLPYLHRRAQENQSVLGGRADQEKRMLWREFRRRMIGQ